MVVETELQKVMGRLVGQPSPAPRFFFLKKGLNCKLEPCIIETYLLKYLQSRLRVLLKYMFAEKLILHLLLGLIRTDWRLF